MIRLLIADDHMMFREGIKGLLDGFADLQVVAEASNHAEMTACIRNTAIDVAVTDFSMPGRDGIDMITHLRTLRTNLPILVLTMHGEAQLAARALRAGASGFITKDAAAEELVGAIRRLAEGGQYVCPPIAEKLALAYSMQDGEAQPHSKLSNKEYKVFEMLVAGKSGNQIAEELSLSAKTVSTHKTRLLRKMNLSNYSELIRYAIQHNLRNTV